MSTQTPIPSASVALLEYYKEQLAHGRHLELQRSTVAGVSLAFSGAVIGELLKGPVTRDKLPYAVALACVGLFAWLLSAKLYERFKIHMEVAKLARNALDPSLASFRIQAQATIRKKYPFLFGIKLHVVWNLLFAFISLIGVATSIIALQH